MIIVPMMAQSMHRTIQRVNLHLYLCNIRQKTVNKTYHITQNIYSSTSVISAAPKLGIPPSSIQTRTFLSATIHKVQNFFRVIFGGNETSPRGLQERQDSYWLLLTLECRALRVEHQQSIGATTVWEKESKEQLSSFLDKAADTLDQDSSMIHNSSLGKLRMDVQRRLEPQILDSLFVASLAEEEFGASDDYEFDKSRIDEYKDILLREHESVSVKLKDWETSQLEEGAKATSTRGDFYKMKKGGIERLLTYYKWWPRKGTATIQPVDEVYEREDEFGFSPNKSSSDITPAMRFHHVKNLIRSYFARQHAIQQNQQFSILPLKSTVPRSGRGVFIDGYAPAGTLLALFPGKVWPKDYLMSASLQTQVNLSENDPRHQLSMRYDDILIDSRSSPYTVYENLWALAHIINHPPAPTISKSYQNDESATKSSVSNGPNCVTAPINYTNSILEHQPRRDLKSFIPNEYEVEPKPWAKNAFDSEEVIMNGMGIIALRDVQDEELFYDYRLSPDEGGSSYPDWYHVFNEDATKNRWSHE